MRTIKALLCLAYVLVPKASQSQATDSAGIAGRGLSDADVAAAIQQGILTKKEFGYVSVAARGGMAGTACRISHYGEGVCAFGIVAQGPFGRIVTAAAEATKQRLPFAPESVTVALREAVLRVVASPSPPHRDHGKWYYAPKPTHMVLQSGPLRVEPLRVDTFTVSWIGAERDGQGISAYFPLSSVPTGDFDVMLLTSGKEIRYGIREKDLDKLK